MPSRTSRPSPVRRAGASEKNVGGLPKGVRAPYLVAKNGNARMTNSVTPLGLGPARPAGGEDGFWKRRVSLPKKGFRGGESEVSASVAAACGRFRARGGAGMGIVYVALG